jgi:hypothetical protein
LVIVLKVPDGTRGKLKLYLKAANTSPKDNLATRRGSERERRFGAIGMAYSLPKCESRAYTCIFPSCQHRATHDRA